MHAVVRPLGSEWALYQNGQLVATSKNRTRLEQVRDAIESKYRANPHARVGENRREAERLYTRFTGHRVTWDQIIELPNIDTAMAVGPCLGIMYRTRRDGRIEDYKHEFAEQSRPLLAVSSDGATALLLGGRFRFTKRGFEDY